MSVSELAVDEESVNQRVGGNLVSQHRRGHKINLIMNKVPSCLVVANCFPSILWLLDLSSVFSEVYVYLFNDKCCEEIVKFLWKDRITILCKEEDAIDKITDFSICKIGVGDVDVLWKLWEKTNVLQLQNTLLVCKYNRLRKQQFHNMRVRWVRFNHADLGGLTSLRWLIGVPRSLFHESLKSSISNLGLNRNFLSIIDEGILGEVCEPSRSSGTALVNLRSFKHDEKLCVPSYRSRTGWVLRSLSFKERALILDVKENTIKIIANSAECSKLKKIIEQGDLVPGKILQIAVTWMLQLWGSPSIHDYKPSRPVENISNITEDVAVILSEADKDYLSFEKRYLYGYGQKAAKNDYEKVPIELWDRFILRNKFPWLKYDTRVTRALDILRTRVAFRYYLFRLRRSLFEYLRVEYGTEWWMLHQRESKNNKRKRDGKRVKSNREASTFQKDVEVGRDALSRAANSSWWEWTHGSSCYFWRFPKCLQAHIRDGYPIHIESALPRYRQRQTFRLTDVGLHQLRKKVEKVVDRGYLEEGYVGSLINYFAVPKGEGDIRVVYDGTKCGLNQCVWAPNFFLPSVDSLLMKVSEKTWFSDMDLGEMFLNFYLDRRIRPFAGVDITNFKESKSKAWLRWNRTLMGFRSSPYIACKIYAMQIFFILSVNYSTIQVEGM